MNSNSLVCAVASWPLKVVIEVLMIAPGSVLLHNSNEVHVQRAHD
jgi:hypothetical protein